jgi:glyoxylase-like metal-dependent hydrolase (beta-lactamase superfamily II)
MDRRSFLRTVLPMTAAVVALPRWGYTASKAKLADLVVTPLTDRIFLISGGGGNVTVFNSPDGVLMVDGGSPEYSKLVLRTVKEHTKAARVHTLFNTHWHWDQTGSNRTLGPAGTRIIAHENTRLWLGTEINSKWQNHVYEPLPKKARPNATFYTTASLSFGGETIDYGYLPQAHTDGDIYVFFRKANVLVAGDVVSVGSYPILDYSTNGWIGGAVNSTQALLELCGNDTRIVPGVGPVQTRTNLEAEHAMLVTLKQRLSQLLAKGMSAQDMLAAAPTKEFDAQWGDPKLFVANAWPGLVQRARELGVSIV